MNDGPSMERIGNPAAMYLAGLVTTADSQTSQSVCKWPGQGSTVARTANVIHGAVVAMQHSCDLGRILLRERRNTAARKHISQITPGTQCCAILQNVQQYWQRNKIKDGTILYIDKNLSCMLEWALSGGRHGPGARPASG
jgi:hypothetical protein